MDNEILRKVQLAQLDMAKEVKRICNKYNINYFMDSGTLLGAVRHKGFIPWDDDLDFGMLREDYEKFLKVAPTELNSKYFLQTWKNDDGFPYGFSKIRKKIQYILRQLIRRHLDIRNYGLTFFHTMFIRTM